MTSSCQQTDHFQRSQKNKQGACAIHEDIQCIDLTYNNQNTLRIKRIFSIRFCCELQELISKQCHADPLCYGQSIL